MPDTPLERGFGGPYDPSIGTRVTRVEADVGELRQDMKALLAAVTRIETVLPHLATQAQIGALRAELAGKPGKLYLWGVLGVLVGTIVASYGAGLAALTLLH
jgi:hypothetical protein